MEKTGGTGRRMLAAFIALSMVSLFADMTYEGARSVIGPYIRLLGGTLLVAGGLSLGELVSYAARTLSGLILQEKGTPRLYWTLIFAGYTVNLGAVPLLALAGHWWVAYTLMILERAGKGLRVPPRDVILAETGSRLGAQRLYAVHEALDQAGAVLGPLIVAWTAERAGIRTGLAVLLIPALAALTLLYTAYTLYPEPLEARAASRGKEAPGGWRASRIARLALAGVGLSFAALPVWPVLSYGRSPVEASTLYALAMLADALAALAAGIVGSRLGGLEALILPVASAVSGVMGGLLLAGSLEGRESVLLGVALWGATMGLYEVYSKSSVILLSREGERAGMFALLGLYMGLAYLASGLTYSLLAGHTGLLLAAPIAYSTLGGAMLAYALSRAII
ncbi:MAG: hypothetical protein LRS48_00120 [Desulfurococcales archaeon]|nr:hypothetical protein [Desulfurococcales archaeon]